MRQLHHQMKGIHLLELLITLSVIGLLITLCWPSYTPHFTKTKRLQAGECLTKLAIAMEKYHIEHNTYQGATLANLHFSDSRIKNNYHLLIQSTSTTDYLLVAKPIGNQAKNDAACGTLTLNAWDEKGISGKEKREDCW